MDILILIGLLFVFLSVSLPIGISLGLATLITMITTESIPTILIAQSAFTGIDSFPLLAIPFFMLAGTLMSYGGSSLLATVLAIGVTVKLGAQNEISRRENAVPDSRTPYSVRRS